MIWLIRCHADLTMSSLMPRHCRRRSWILFARHIPRMITVKHFYVPLAVRSSRTRTLGCHYGMVCHNYWWPKMYKWVSTYLRTCESCKRVKPSPHSAAPLASLPVPTGCWESIRMNFAFVLPKDAHGNTSIVVFVDRLIKMDHLAAMPDLIDGDGTAQLLVN